MAAAPPQNPNMTAAVLLLALQLLCRDTAAVAAVATPPRPLKVIILAGQSNM
jgi:hypothetical protein